MSEQHSRADVDVVVATAALAARQVTDRHLGHADWGDCHPCSHSLHV